MSKTPATQLARELVTIERLTLTGFPKPLLILNVAGNRVGKLYDVRDRIDIERKLQVVQAAVVREIRAWRREGRI